MNGKERVQTILRGKSPDHLPLMPITMAFAADQVGVKYRDYATDHHTLIKAQLKTAEVFNLDYVSTISDPAREAADCGANVEFFADQPPAIVETEARLANVNDLATLKQPDPLGGGRMHDRVQAVAGLANAAGDELIVEGWVEGPCAEAADLRGINRLMLDFMDEPLFVHDLFAFVVEMELAFAKAQVDAGAALIGLGDAAASLVGPQIYQNFVWEYENQLVQGIQALGVPVRLHICGNTTAILNGMGRLGCELVDIDFMASMAAARAAMGPDQVLLGNLDPVRDVRNADPNHIRACLDKCFAACRPNYIVGAGCEIPRDTPAENMQALTEFAKSH